MNKNIMEEANRIITALEKCCSKNKNIMEEIDNISDIEVAKLVMKYMLKKINRLYFSVKYF